MHSLVFDLIFQNAVSSSKSSCSKNFKSNSSTVPFSKLHNVYYLNIPVNLGSYRVETNIDLIWKIILYSIISKRILQNRMKLFFVRGIRHCE